jgi:hypothetical protein
MSRVSLSQRLRTWSRFAGDDVTTQHMRNAHPRQRVRAEGAGRKELADENPMNSADRSVLTVQSVADQIEHARKKGYTRILTTDFKRRAIEGDMLQQIANLCRADASQRQEFAEDLDRSIHRIWMQHYLAKRASGRLKRASRAALALNEALVNLEQEEIEDLGISYNLFVRLDRFSSEEYSGFQGFQATAFHLAELLCWHAGTREPLWPGEIDEGLRAGRRSGTVGKPLLQEFIRDLKRVGKQHGKGFTFSHETVSGSLIKALDLLRNYLPPGVVPVEAELTKLGSTIKRIRPSRGNPR